MAIRSTERELGDKWAEHRERAGAWIVKIPASLTAGFPDWMVLHGKVELWEAKRLQRGGQIAFSPSQLSGAQRFFLKMIALYAPEAGGVLLLGEEGFVERPARLFNRTVTHALFRRLERAYD